MKRFTTDPSAPAALRMTEADEPTLGPSECLVEVKAYSLNRGEIGFAPSKPAGSPIGWDVAGIVAQAADDGTGPAVGSRVVAFLEKADGWAERINVPTDAVAVLPDSVGFELASTLPVAALTALHCCEKAGPLFGRRALITGATGGVGLFAVQIAKAMGALVTAQVRRDDQVPLVRTYGADEAVVSPEGAELASVAPFQLIVDGVGGPIIPHLVNALVPGGTLCCYGASAGNEGVLRIFPDFVGNGSNRRILGMTLYTEAERHADAFARLLPHVEAGRVTMEISRTEPWEKTPELAQGLLDRTFLGKAVATLP